MSRKAQQNVSTVPGGTVEPPNLSHIAESLRPLAVACESIEMDPANARKHGPENLAAIRGSLMEFGQRKPIVVNKRTNHVEAGNGALTVAREIGWTHIAVVFVDDDPGAAAGFSVADNQTAILAEWDEVALAALLAQIDVESAELQVMLDAMKPTEQVEATPGEFKAVDESIHVEHVCPNCGFQWSGGKVVKEGSET